MSAESPSSWPIEALKAQAVAARTYAIATSKGGAGFEHYADTRSQVYGGVAVETPTTNRAVAETAGQVVTYQGRPVVTYFFSTSGGRTENVENSLGGTPQPWLRSVEDPYDDVSPRHRWKPVRMTLGAAGAQAERPRQGLLPRHQGRQARHVAAGRDRRRRRHARHARASPARRCAPASASTTRGRTSPRSPPGRPRRPSRPRPTSRRSPRPARAPAASRPSARMTRFRDDRLAWPAPCSPPRRRAACEIQARAASSGTRRHERGPRRRVPRRRSRSPGVYRARFRGAAGPGRSASRARPATVGQLPQRGAARRRVGAGVLRRSSATAQLPARRRADVVGRRRRRGRAVSVSSQVSAVGLEDAEVGDHLDRAAAGQAEPLAVAAAAP